MKLVPTNGTDPSAAAGKCNVGGPCESRKDDAGIAGRLLLRWRWPWYSSKF